MAKLIVLYGVNRTGKTTQAKLLVNYFKSQGRKAFYVKYPVLRVKPSGPYLNQIIRGGKKQKISEEELQMWFAINRFQYEPKLRQKLAQGINVIVEDYVGTGLVWGSFKGAKLEWLEIINKPFLKADISILLAGNPFSTYLEENHIHEWNERILQQCATHHSRLAKRYGWHIVDAHETREKVQREIVEIISSKLKTQNAKPQLKT